MFLFNVICANLAMIYSTIDVTAYGLPGVWEAGKKNYLFSGGWGALVIILGELGSKLIVLVI